MMDVIAPPRVVAKLRAGNKKQALHELASKAGEALGIDQKRIFDVLMERERLGTTGVGHGIAIPHGKLPDLSSVFGMFAQLDKPVNFDAIDEQPVDLIYLLLAPENAGADHLKALARVSRMLRDKRLCAKLRGCNSADSLYALLSDTENVSAA